MSQKAAQIPYVHQAYPKVLYADGNRTTIVANQVEHQQLGEGWHESPLQVGSAPAAPAAPPAPVITDEARIAAEAEAVRQAEEAAAQAAAEAAAAEKDATDRASSQHKEAAEMQAVYDAPAAALIQSTGGASAENLMRLRAIESANPKVPGGRKTVLEAIEKALAKLAPKE